MKEVEGHVDLTERTSECSRQRGTFLNLDNSGMTGSRRLCENDYFVV